MLKELLVGTVTVFRSLLRPNTFISYNYTFVRMDYFLKSRHVLGETHTPTIRAKEGERERNFSKLRLDAGKLSELILKLQK